MNIFQTDNDYNKMSPEKELVSISEDCNLSILEEDFSLYMDSKDPLRQLRDDFHLPLKKYIHTVDTEVVDGNEECIYMCGNSLGLQPKAAQDLVSKEMEQWAKQDILSDNEPSCEVDADILYQMSTIVGAKTEEVTIMNALTVNLHFMLVSFYQPTPQRHKILIESKAFPSDHYVAESQIRYHGYEPETSLIVLEPRPGEELLRTEDIEATIEKEGDSIMLILLPGVQYYTGQLFDMKTITKAGHRKGCWVTFDIAHAVGNAELQLHEWGVDFACWCTYKYLNSGPGCIGGAFLHERHKNNNFKKFLGPWGSCRGDSATEGVDTAHSAGIKEYEMGPPNPLLLSCLKSSLDVFSKTSMKELRSKCFYLTGYLEFLVKCYFNENSSQSGSPSVRIITPRSFKHRGVQLSLTFSVPITEVHRELMKRGVLCDVRKPSVIRVAPAPIYCSFHDVYRFVDILRMSFKACETSN